MIDYPEGLLALQRALTALCSGFNAVYFVHSWSRLPIRRSGGNSTQGRWVASVVLVLTNLAFFVGAVWPAMAPRLRLDPSQAGLDLLPSFLLLAASAAMTLLILRARWSR